jgi:hypothetical protein
MDDEKEKYIKECIKNIIASSHMVLGSINDTPEQVSIKLLKQRFEASKKAFVILYQNDCKYEATIIAGYMFELQASIYHLEQGAKTFQNIMGNIAYKYMEMVLQYPSKNEEKIWNEYFKTALEFLHNFGQPILKQPEKVYNMLNDDTLTQEEKLRDFGRCHKRKPIQNSIDDFINHIKKVMKKFVTNYRKIDYLLHNFYLSYCCFKHNNFLSFFPQEKDVAEVVCFLSIVAYYNDFKELDSLEEKYKKLFGEN